MLIPDVTWQRGVKVAAAADSATDVEVDWNLADCWCKPVAMVEDEAAGADFIDCSHSPEGSPPIALMALISIHWSAIVFTISS